MSEVLNAHRNKSVLQIKFYRLTKFKKLTDYLLIQNSH